jgi:hypothetical protein
MPDTNERDEEDLDEYVSVGLNKYDKVEPVITVPEEKGDKIYRQDRDFLQDLEERVVNRMPRYKEKSPSARHAGLRPMMISLMSLIHRASRLAAKRHKVFYGLTLYECQKAMKICNVSNHTVKQNLQKLVDLGLVEKKIVKLDGESQERVFYSLKETADSYPCQDGAYVIVNSKGIGSKGLFVLNCPSYPHCSLRKKDCRIEVHLRRLAQVLPAHLKDISGGRVQIGDLLEDVSGPLPSDQRPKRGAPSEARKLDRREEGGDGALEEIVESPSPVPWTDLDQDQRDEINEEVIRLRTGDSPLTYRDVLNRLRETHNVELKRYNIYEAMKEVEEPDGEEGRFLKYSSLGEEDRREVDDLLVELRSQDPPKTYGECARIARERLGVEVSRYNIYSATK